MDLSTLLPLFLQAAGGAVLGPALSGLIGGKGFGFLGNAVAGIVGGLAAAKGMDVVNLDVGAMMGGGSLMRTLAEFVKGGIGGGALGVIAGLIRR